VTGTVYLDTQVPLAGATVRADSDKGTIATVQTDGSGIYTFDAIPEGTVVTLTVTATAYGSRTTTFSTIGPVMTINFTDAQALTNKPEVIAVSPKDRTTGVSPTSPIVLTFSTPMDKASVASGFALQLNQANPMKLITGATLPGFGWPPNAGNTVMDVSSFDVKWDSATKVTFSPIVPYPTAINGTPPTYRLSLAFNSNTIKTSSGQLALTSEVGDRNRGPFIVNNQQLPFTTFTVANASGAALRMTSIYAQGSRIKLQFNQTLYRDYLFGKIAGGMDGTATNAFAANDAVSSAAAAANYQIQINSVGGYKTFQGPDFPGAKAYFDISDPMHQTVFLEADNPIANPNDTVEVKVISSALDALGNRLPLDGTANYARIISL
jgi:hypothetical protein